MEDARPGWFVRVMPPALITIPVALAVVAYAVGATPRQMAEAPRRPSVAFAQHLVDLGLVQPQEEVFAHFDFTNRGRELVRITDLVPSCGCLKPEMRKNVYYPEESGHFLVRVQTANENPGPKEYRITVKYEDPQPREAEVVFRVTLPENQVLIRPSVLPLYQLSDEPLTETVDVIDRREKPFRVVKVECTRSQVAKVELAERETDENGHTHQRIRVTVPADLHEGRSDAVIRIYTDDPAYRALRVPLRVHTKRTPFFSGKNAPIPDPHVRPASATDEESGHE